MYTMTYRKKNQMMYYMSIILPLLLIPSWALAIAQRLPVDCPLMHICLAIMDVGPGPGPKERTEYIRLLGSRAQIHYG